MSRPRRAALCVATFALVAACSDTAPPRRQIVVVIDTDAPTLEDLGMDAELSGAASVDTVRVDILDEKDGVTVLREFSATSRLDWPLSFALIPPEDGDVRTTTLRVRAFRARDAEPTVEASVPTLSPIAELAIDRVVQIPAPAAHEIVRAEVKLSADCLGSPASFRDRTSCQDGAHLVVPFNSPLPVAEPGRPTNVGTSPIGHSVPCAQPAPKGRVCVPGGLSILGSRLIAGLEDGDVTLSPIPLRLARVSPFFMDETELTVGRARPLLERLRSAQPYRKGSTAIDDADYCTLSDDPRSDNLPLNCVEDETAAELCVLAGGALPTEAEWNHASTGRGQGRLFPWGDVHKGCCNASASRLTRLFPTKHQCNGEGAEPVGSHRGSAACGGFGDISRDGALDLGGSLVEVLADRARPLDDPCRGPRFGILVDPVCAIPNAIGVATRGGEWASGVLTALSAQRGAVARGSTRGLRCVYREAAR